MFHVIQIRLDKTFFDFLKKQSKLEFTNFNGLVNKTLYNKYNTLYQEYLKENKNNDKNNE